MVRVRVKVRVRVGVKVIRLTGVTIVILPIQVH